MIHPLKEEIYIIIYLVAYGIYLISTYDVILFCINKANWSKIIKVIIEILYCIIQLVITYFFSYKLATGYIPIYFIVFLIIGFTIYIYLLRKTLIKTLSFYDQNIKPFVLNILKTILIPYELITLFKWIFKKIIKKKKLKN